MGRIKSKEKKEIKRKHVRPSWDEYFMNIREAVSKRATCDRGRAACVVVKDNRILVTGYVGSPSGISHCDDVGHEMHEVIHEDGSHSKHCIRTVHAEQNALAQAARYGIPIEGSTIYLNMEPCYTCSKLLINAGVKKVVCNKRYHAGKRTREVLKEANVKLAVLHDEEEEYDNKK